jgi:WD40 repeat protein
MWSPSGKLLDTLTGHSDKITCFKYHNDKLISGSQDTQLRIWDLQSMKCIRKLNAHTNGITCLDSNGILIASGDMYGNFILWHFGSGNMLGKYGFKDSFVHLIDDFIQADPDTIQYLHLNDDLLLVGTLQGTSFLFELEDVKDSLDYLLETWTSNGLFIKRKLDTNVRWTMNGVADPWKVIVTTTTGKIYVYNHKSAKLLYVLSDGKETAFTKVISNEGNIITCGSDGIVRCWRIGSSL